MDIIAMVGRDSRPGLQQRIKRLREAVRILEVEISDLEQELNNAEGRGSAVLTESFFWENVFPQLLSRGFLTSAELRERLKINGLSVDSGLFRTFLSRARDRGWLELQERQKGRPHWRVTPEAVEKAKDRSRREK